MEVKERILRMNNAGRPNRQKSVSIIWIEWLMNKKKKQTFTRFVTMKPSLQRNVLTLQPKQFPQMEDVVVRTATFIEKLKVNKIKHKNVSLIISIIFSLKSYYKINSLQT